MLLNYGCEGEDKYIITLPRIKQELRQRYRNISSDKEDKEPKLFYIEDIHRRKGKIYFYKDKVVFKKIRESIVIINIFSDKCAPCRGMLPYLSDLQKKNRKKIFVIGVLVKSKLDRKGLIKFMKKYHLNFFISNHSSSQALSDKFVKI